MLMALIPSVKLLVVDEARGATNTLVSLTMPGDVIFDHFRGQERVVCFLAHCMGPWEEVHIVVVHLDYPTTILRMDVPGAASIDVSRSNPSPQPKSHRLGNKDRSARYLLTASRLARRP
jgi:hypothetical protein